MELQVKRRRRRKRNRPEPITEGCLADIYKWFFGKLIFLKPEATTIGDWMEQLFDSKNRDVIRFVVKKNFTMPGLYYAASNIKYQGIGYRKVKRKEELWVRTDAHEPNRVDIEWLGGQGQKDQVFCLTASEWGWVKLHCVEKDVGDEYV